MSTLANPQGSTSKAGTIFSHVLVGIDGSPESLEAARQAALLEEPGGTLSFLAAWNLAPPLVTAGLAPPVDDADVSARANAEDALRQVKEELPAAATLLVHGFAAHALIDEVERGRITLVAVGSHGQGRIAGALLGSTTTSLVHGSPCSVLVARKAWSGPPRRIAVGVDGSPESAAAYAAARQLADRFGSDLTVVVAEGSSPVDLAGVSLVVGDGYHVVSEEPVPVLEAASADVDLLVIGSRGLHGLKSLGSVSERVAHRAQCSTLIVRTS
jgi:nucleotide-binding universal stress UspA family protein